MSHTTHQIRNMNDMSDELLKDIYALLSDLWCSPENGEMSDEEIGNMLKRLETMDKRTASEIISFLKEKISEEEYIEVFELDPKCPLYLGAHTYEEPTTCAGAAMSDRNEYMIELLGMYNHFGLKIDKKELPDHLPLVLEFLSLTCNKKADPIRKKFIEEYFLPYLPPMKNRLEELKSPYVHLIYALERVLNLEIEETKKKEVVEYG